MSGQFAEAGALSRSDRLRLLSVRIMDSAKVLKGSGLIYTCDSRTAYVLTAAHVVKGITYPIFIECQPDKGDEKTTNRDKYIFSVKCSDEVITASPEWEGDDDNRAYDAAIIRLNLDSDRHSWMEHREQVYFLPDDKEIKDQHVTGFGYPKFKKDSPIEEAYVEADPEKTKCSHYTQTRHSLRWQLGIYVSDNTSKEEFGGWSGGILVFENQEQFVLAGIVLERYREFRGGEILGADMHYIQELLKNEIQEIRVWKETGVTNSVVAVQTPEREMQSASVFNLRYIKSMLEGAPDGHSWAHALRNEKNLPDVVFRVEIGKRMTLVRFADDRDFLEKLLPEQMRSILCDGDSTALSVAAIMDGTYSDEKKMQMIYTSWKGEPTPISRLIARCEMLMNGPNWERHFVAAYQAFFSLMGEEVRYFRYQMQDCKAHDNMAAGMAMFVMYALLGDDYYKAMITVAKKSVEELFR